MNAVRAGTFVLLSGWAETGIPDEIGAGEQMNNVGDKQGRLMARPGT